MALIWPNGSTAIPRVTSEYGYRTHPITRLKRLHKGIDLAGFELVRSPVTGVVVTSGYQPTGAGHYVNVRSTTGDLYKFFHLKKGTKVPVGTRVQPGSVLGVMGKTGAVTGVHLHFEVWPGGRAPSNPRTHYSQHQLHAEAAPTTPEDDMPYTKDELTQIAANGVAQALEGKQATTRLRRIMWALPTVKRGGREIEVIQELADTNTRLIEVLERLKKIESRLPGDAK